MPSHTFYGSTTTANTDRRPSTTIWGDMDVEGIRSGSRGGYYDEDDFNNQGPITAVTTDAHLIGMNYMGFNSSGGTHTMVDGIAGGLVVTEATDNEASYVRRASWPFRVSSELGKLAFEARVKVNAITDNQIGFIMGLWSNVACSVIVPLSTANPPVMATTGDFIGFWGPEEDAGGVDAIYKAGGVTEVVTNAACHQFVADTYVKLGFKFLPAKYHSTGVAKIGWYVNGVLQATEKTVPENTGTDFPADVPLNFMFGHRLGASTSSLTTCDWWRCYQWDA